VYLGTNRTDRGIEAEQRLAAIDKLWDDVVGQVISHRPQFVSKVIDDATGIGRLIAQEKWITSDQFEADMREFVQSGHIVGHIIVDDAASDEFRLALDNSFPEGAVAPKE
jgi:hypothetical protein